MSILIYVNGHPWLIFFGLGVILCVLSMINFLAEGMSNGHKMNMWMISAAYGNAKDPAPVPNYGNAITLGVLGAICLLVASLMMAFAH